MSDELPLGRAADVAAHAFRRPDMRVAEVDLAEGHLLARRFLAPDLVVEVDVTSSCVNRMPIYAALRVPELWRHGGETVIFYGLDPSGNYVKADRSLAFPKLKPEDINRFLDLRHTMDENSLIRLFVEWVRETMKPE